MLLASVFPVLNANAAILSNVETSAITVKEQISCAYDYRPTLVVKDQHGNIIKQTTVGAQVSLEASSNLDCSVPRDSAISLFEVRDAEGITVYLAWQTISADSRGQMATSLSWTPDKPGNYEARFLYTPCLRCPGVLVDVASYEIAVV